MPLADLERCPHIRQRHDGIGVGKRRFAELYASFSTWCDCGKEPAISRKRFGEALGERGFERQRSSGVWYRGITLRNDVQEGEDEEKD